jgi:hypothetical protein
MDVVTGAVYRGMPPTAGDVGHNPFTAGSLTALAKTSQFADMVRALVAGGVGH